MHRRALLRAGPAIGVALSLPRSVSASPSSSAGSVARAQEPFEPLDRIDVDGAAEVVVGDGGDVAYLATSTGFATVDVSDPAALEVLAAEDRLEADGRPLTQILDVEVDGDRLVVPGPANRSSDDVFYGFACYDVSDPADPALAADPYETGFHIHNCALEGDVLYVVANMEDENPLVVYDVADGIEEIGRWSLVEHESEWQAVDWRARYLHDVSLHDDVAYLPHWNAGTYLLDVSDPSAPEYVSHVRETDLEEQLAMEDAGEAQQGLPGNDHYAAVDETGDLLAVGRESWTTGGDEPDGPGGIDLYDVSDPAEPTHLSTIDAPASDDASYYGGEWTTSHNFELRNDRLYSSWYQGGVKVHDVADPAEPTELASWRATDTAGFWTARVVDPGETIVASSTELIPNAETEGALYTFPVPSADDEAGSDAVPGLTAPAVLAGGAVALEWLRRRSDEKR